MKINKFQILIPLSGKSFREKFRILVKELFIKTVAGNHIFRESFVPF